MLRIGRIKYVNGRQVYPSYQGYTSIVVMTKSSAYGSLGPYELKTEEGHIFENVWQFSKVYEIVPKSKEVYTQIHRVLAWEHPMEIHIKGEYYTPEYWAWRQKGFNNPIAVRYPVGRANMHRCKFAIPYETKGSTDDTLVPVSSIEHLDYIQSRKRTYLPLYINLVQDKAQFIELKRRLQQGENLLIIEVDGPHEESLQYYKDTYQDQGVDDTFIQKDTMLATPENLKIMLNDKKHPYGHGYCLCVALLGLDLNTL